MLDLTDKVAIITGSSRGIGASVAKLLASRGAKVVINYRNSPNKANEVAESVRQLGGEATIIQADVSQNKEAQALVQATIEVYQHVDILINNVGTTRDALIMKMSEDDWDTVLQTNLSSMYYCSKAVVRPMLKRRYGRIINITSVVGLAGQVGQTNYAASKAGIVGFTKSLAKEVGSRNITVNAIAPGFIPTALTQSLSEKMIEEVVKNTPLGRLGHVDDIANAVLFFASDEAAFITGQVLAVDGGLVMQ
jgi:3-oxoacyl-[acyl-carrier protein] reductase